MIRVTVELHQYGTGKLKQLGIMDICNKSTGTDDRGNYEGFLYRKGLKAKTRTHGVIRYGNVDNFPRNSYVVWRLILRMLRDMYPEEQPKTLPVVTWRPLSEWTEEDGHAFWAKFPVQEPYYAGSPLCTDWPNYHTHFIPMSIFNGLLNKHGHRK